MALLEWDDLRFFLAIARGGTLSAAAKTLGVTQPTVGRRLVACEQRLGTRLFDRTRPRSTGVIADRVRIHG